MKSRISVTRDTISSVFRVLFKETKLPGKLYRDVEDLKSVKAILFKRCQRLIIIYF